MLIFIGKPVELSVLDGWCPLMIKEFSNSGHLDSIAVFFTTAALFCALKAFFADRPLRSRDAEVYAAESVPRPASSRWLWLCSVCIAAAVGAKIYPVVLFPWWFFGAWRAFSLRRAVCAACVTFLLCIGMISPTLNPHADTVPGAAGSLTSSLADADELPPLPDDLPMPIGEPEERTEVNDGADTGLAAFAGHWQMNDFLFMPLLENHVPICSVVETQVEPVL